MGQVKLVSTGESMCKCFAVYFVLRSWGMAYWSYECGQAAACVE